MTTTTTTTTLSSRGSPAALTQPTRQVDVSEGVACGCARRRQDVDGLVGDVVAVAEVQLGKQRQAADDEAQRRVSDVQAGQPQLLHIAQLALVVQLTCGSGEGDDEGV